MTTRELIDKYSIRANKSLGQNFLQRDDIIEDIANAAAGYDNALEIGAGLGVLSRVLCSKFKKVSTIEIDRSLKAVTDETLSGIDNHTLIYADFLRFDLGTLDFDGTLAVVGNLPYNITGEIVTKLLKNRDMFGCAVIMVQKEAADKLMSAPSKNSYRAISVLTQYFCEITHLFDVSPDSFIPAPHVTSSVIRLDFKKSVSVPNEKIPEFFAFVHKIFNQRRKILLSIFHNPEEKELAKSALENLGLSDKTRGEALSPDTIADIYLKVYCEQK